MTNQHNQLDARRRHKRWSQFHYNAVAKEIREVFPVNDDPAIDRIVNQTIRYALANLALNFATRFNQDWLEAEEGYAFKPEKFLDACSPNPELYPLSELWKS